MKIATWNINGVKARIDAATTWLKSASPDIACLQEIKCVDEAFPKESFEALGYNVAVHGQRGFNGVALLSKLPFDEVKPRLAGDPQDVQARYLEAVVSVPSGVLRLLNIYLPNGNPVGTEKYVYKLAWMARLRERVKALLALEEPLIVAGDFNVIPTPEDVYNPAAWTEDALFKHETRAAFQALIHLGLTDAFRA
jgi:exodeoxyribonuclease-3